ncbi:hypothetical protein B0A69_19070 [Chryseobacterium shigense]|uniref:Uncharacterized protein n=1 Tax=Chryseobacterium shigense TaxID=297244 RepID=A0A1N7HYT7_9FLAO|nr:hypothetical protein [Chryseobacterium shigense]PQA90839.1 hypothetical protein B0A69_19070 [Chryseobacterium shigense]SIS30014.1 hypothetical protein SAMN05421639_101679 [Chryseobacterium shigense]
MVRRILAVPAGLIAGIICITIIEKIGHQMYPPPAGAGSDDMVAMKNYVAQAPFMALFFVIMAYAVAGFVAGFVASKVARNGKHTSAAVCGVIFLCITLYMMASLPTPIWFWVLGIAVWGLVFAGSRLALKTKKI